MQIHMVCIDANTHSLSLIHALLGYVHVNIYIWSLAISHICITRICTCLVFVYAYRTGCHTYGHLKHLKFAEETGGERF